MIVINLDKGFNCTTGIGMDFFTFPSGCEIHGRLEATPKTYYSWEDHDIIITARIRSSDDVFKVLQATDVAKSKGAKSISLFIPYMPYARQDRRTDYREPFSLKIMADIINLQGYKKVYIYDPHSDVTTALISNCHPITNHVFVESILKNKKDYLIVSPDAGAYKKVYDVCKHINYTNEIVSCSKHRDVSSGHIDKVEVNAVDLQVKDCYIIDDICDGGLTFTMVADVLKRLNAGKVNLIVSHGIFSKGIEALHNIDHIYTTNSFKNIDNSDRLTQVKLKL